MGELNDGGKDMRLVTYLDAGQPQTGLLMADQVLPLAAAAQQCGVTLDASSILAIVRAGVAAEQALQRIWHSREACVALCRSLASVQLLAPIPNPSRNVFCVGRNYVDHVKEGGVAMQMEVKLPTVPQFFTKATHAVNAPYGDIRIDSRVSRRYDYEVELAVVMGKTGRDIPREQAFEYVYGYAVGNDVTARDLQRRHDQWFKGKSLDTCFPFGPCLVTKDEVAEVSALQLSLWVNGELRQQAAAAQMIFDIPAIIESLSAGMTLEAGDIIATGTPAGVGFAMDPPQYLADGDEVVCSISNLGELRNRVMAVV